MHYFTGQDYSECWSTQISNLLTTENSVAGPSLYFVLAQAIFVFLFCYYFSSLLSVFTKSISPFFKSFGSMISLVSYRKLLESAIADA